MPQQAPLRLVKRWRRYWPRERWRDVPPFMRGFYVLYDRVAPRRGRITKVNVAYIGISVLWNERRWHSLAAEAT